MSVCVSVGRLIRKEGRIWLRGEWEETEHRLRRRKGSASRSWCRISQSGLISRAVVDISKAMPSKNNTHVPQAVWQNNLICWSLQYKDNVVCQISQVLGQSYDGHLNFRLCVDHMQIYRRPYSSCWLVASYGSLPHNKHSYRYVHTFHFRRVAVQKTYYGRAKNILSGHVFLYVCI